MAQVGKGSILGSYRLEERIGRGGMGVVYRATHLGLDRQVALKLIAEDLSEDEGFRERFRREPRIAAAIEHPNVVPVFDAGEIDGQLYVAMRLVQGDDLGTVIRDEGSLDPQRATRIVSQVGDALDAAHDHDLVHRDVKPGNVLLETRGGEERAYLTDFGITKGGGGSAGLTRTGDWVGTVDYVAPEQIEGKDVDKRTDVYALGAVLYHALAGEAPYAEESEVAKIYAHLSKPPPSVRQKLKRVSPELDATIRRAMAKSPKDRYSNAGEFGREALSASAGQAQLSRATQELLREPEPEPEPPPPAPETRISKRAAKKAAKRAETRAAKPPAAATAASSAPAAAADQAPAPPESRPEPPKPQPPKRARRRRAKQPAKEAAPAAKAKTAEPDKSAEPDKVAGPAQPTAAPSAKGPPAKKTGRRQPALVALAVVGVIALGVAGYLIGSSGDDGGGEESNAGGSSGSSAAASGPDPAYAQGVNAAFQRLNRTGKAEASALRKAGTNDAQAAELDDLASAYGTAAVSLRKLKPEPDVAPTNKAVIAALGNERDAYRRVAAAARDADESAYASARTAVRRAQARLNAAVRRYGTVGYQVG